jgi:hypothetical protein
MSLRKVAARHSDARSKIPDPLHDFCITLQTDFQLFQRTVDQFSTA